jgi:hypothetical protein
MSVELKNNTFVSYLIVLLALFILILFTKDQVMNMQYNLDQKEQINTELKEVRIKQQALVDTAADVEKQESETQRYLTPFTENEILEYFHDYADSVNTGSGTIVIKSINISEKSENELGFFETKVNINAEVSDKKMMKVFLDYLVAEDAKYRFFIDSFLYPNDERDGSFNIQVPLKIFYR